MNVVASKVVHRAGAPVGLDRITGELPLPSYTITSVVGALTMVALNEAGLNAGGTFINTGGGVYTYEPPNELHNLAVRFHDDGGNVDRALAVTGSLPLQPDFGYAAPLDDNSKISVSPDGEVGFVLELGTPFVSRELSFTTRTRIDMWLLFNFWNFHRKSREFWYVDDELNEVVLSKFDSKLDRRVRGGNAFDLSCLVKRA